MGPRSVDRAQKRNRLLEAAAKVFSERGFKRTTMAEVARRADVGKGTVYEYFESKESLFLELLDWYCSVSLQAAAPSGGEKATATESLKAFGQDTVRLMLENWDLFPLSMEFWSEASQTRQREGLFKVMKGMYEGYRSVVVAILRAGQASGEFRKGLDLEALATMVVGGFDGMFLQYHFDPSLDPAAIADRFMEVFIEGIRTKKGKANHA
jgi:TetR/AcrR family fatty acid metabolism transcriptional regulator